MKFEISNLGYLDKAAIELGNLTVVCGFNNTGKTYLSYAIWGFFEHWKEYGDFKFLKDYHYEEYLKNKSLKINFDKHQKEICSSINKAAQEYGKDMQNIFNFGEDFLSNVQFNISIEPVDFVKMKLEFEKTETKTETEIKNTIENSIKKVLTEVLFKVLIPVIMVENIELLILPRPFVVTSERTGVSLFLKELDKNKSEVVDELLKKQLRKGDFTIGSDWADKISRYAEPIKFNINTIRDLSQISKQKSFLLAENSNKNHQEILELWNDIMQGSYKITEHEIFFIPKEKEGRSEIPLPMYASASAVKSLLLLDVFIKHSAKQNSILFIDEPELNLHPEVQRKLADLFVRLSNIGIKIFITTHSDYLMKELNNLIMLSNIPERKDIFEKYGYSELSILKKENIKAYVTENHTLNPIEISDEGLETDIFDATALKMNQAADAIYYANK